MKTAGLNTSPFFAEWISAYSSPHFLPISTTCNCSCIFCTNKFNIFPCQTGLLRDIEDIRHQLSLMRLHENPINLTSIIPGRLPEGEAFLHPQFFQILQLVRRKYPRNQLVFNSNCAGIDAAFIKELSRYNPVSIGVSLHSTRPDLWAHIFGRSEADAQNVLQAIRLLAEYHCALWGAIVPLPNLCGWNDIEQTISFMMAQGARRMVLHCPGYTRLTPRHVIDEIECPLPAFTDFACRIRAARTIQIDDHPAMQSALNLPLKTVVSQTLRGNLRNRCGPYRTVLWLVSQAAHRRIDAALQLISLTENTHVLHPVPNSAFGGNVIIGGLLTVDDFIAAGRAALAAHPDTELILIPDAPFDAFGRDLLYQPVHMIAEALKKTVWVVKQDGACMPLLEAPLYEKTAGDSALPEEELRVFYAFLEDETLIERSLDLAAGYPFETTWGNLSRNELKSVLQQNIRTACGDMTSRSTLTLDPACVLFLEQWRTAHDRLTLVNRSVCFIKQGAKWKLRWLRQGEDHRGLPLNHLSAGLLPMKDRHAQ